MLDTILAAQSACLDHGTCIECATPVTIIVARDGGLALTDIHGYCGTTDSGEFVCRDHFCIVCGESHTDVDEFDVCAFYGADRGLLLPPCALAQ